MTMQNPKTCYMCFAPATSEEHTPPKCIFPEQKDLPKGFNYRKNLIKVPSCDLHNSSKSKDDEYLLMMIAAHIENNTAGHDQFATKILRALKRNPNLSGIFAYNQKTVLNGQSVVAIKADTSRFVNVLEHTARAIYFYEFKKKWLDDVEVFLPSLMSYNEYLDRFNKEVNSTRKRYSLITAQELSEIKFHGDNPEVFQYQITSDPTIGAILLKMLFYGGFEAVAVLLPSLPDNYELVVVTREEIEACDISGTLARLTELLQNRQEVISHRNKLGFAFTGYSTDERELFEVPEFREFMWRLTKEFPFWFYFMDKQNDMLRLIFFSLCRYIKIAPGLTKYHSQDGFEIMQFLFGNINILFDRYKLPESDIEVLSQEIDGYFSSASTP